MSDEKYQKCFTVFSCDEDDQNFPPENIQELISWLNEKLEEVPGEYRSIASFQISCNYCQESIPMVEILYRRPETDEEIKSRKELEEMRVSCVRSEDLRQLAKDD